MTENQRAKWQKTRAKGRAHFIWFRGVFSWGLTTTVLWSMFMAVVMVMDMVDAGFFAWLAGAIVFFPIGGYFWGVWVWKLSERKYLQTVEADAIKDRVEGLKQEVAGLKEKLGRASTEEGGTGA